MIEQLRANELITKYGAVIADNICDEIITVLQDDWNQDKIYFYLDVKNCIKNQTT